MRRQRGVTLPGLLGWGVVIVIVAVLGLRIAPEVIDYYKIKKIVASTAANSQGKTVPEIRATFDKYADIDNIQAISANDLDISKEGNQVVIAFAYERRIPLFANVSLLIDFHGASSER